MRDPNNQERLEPLKKAFGLLYSQLELAPADLTDDYSILKACEGATYIVHTASPLPEGFVWNHDLVTVPAVNGTLSVLKAARLYKVKRVVITSSILAVLGTMEKTSFNTDDWSDINHQDAYSKSKTMSEKAAWDYQASLPEEERFEITTICPGLISGPNLNSGTFLSANIVKMFMKRELPSVSPIPFPFVDVRDVAQAHLNAILEEEAANKRFLLVESCPTTIELSSYLNERWEGQFDCPSWNPRFPLYLMWFGSFFSRRVNGLYTIWD